MLLSSPLWDKRYFIDTVTPSTSNSGQGYSMVCRYRLAPCYDVPRAQYSQQTQFWLQFHACKSKVTPLHPVFSGNATQGGKLDKTCNPSRLGPLVTVWVRFIDNTISPSQGKPVLQNSDMQHWAAGYHVKLEPWQLVVSKYSMAIFIKGADVLGP